MNYILQLPSYVYIRCVLWPILLISGQRARRTKRFTLRRLRDAHPHSTQDPGLLLALIKISNISISDYNFYDRILHGVLSTVVAIHQD